MSDEAGRRGQGPEDRDDGAEGEDRRAGPPPLGRADPYRRFAGRRPAGRGGPGGGGTAGRTGTGSGRSAGRRPGKGRGSPPRRLGNLVDRLLEKLGVAEGVERASVMAEWEERVGSGIASRARPVGMDGKTLFVEVESASWMMELQMMKRELLERLNAGRSRGRVEKIVFVQGGRRVEGDEGGPERGGPRDEADG